MSIKLSLIIFIFLLVPITGYSQVTKPAVGVEMCLPFEMVDVDPSVVPQPVIETVTSPLESYTAYTVCLPQAEVKLGCLNHVFVKFEKTGRVQGINSPCFIPGRPIINLTWKTEDILTFYQWANPNYGHQFVIDVINAKMLEEWTFNDEYGPR